MQPPASLPRLSWARPLFYGGLLVACLLRLLAPRSVSLELTAFTLGALLVTLIAGFRLAVRYARRGLLGQALGYGFGGLLAVGLYCAALPALAEAGDALDFYLRRPRLESLRLRNGFLAGEEPMGGFCSWLDSSTFLCMSGGQVGLTCWGYAYSTTGKKPQWADNYIYWHHMDGRWYRWVRSDW